jgi:hypothetical protein
MQRFGWRHSITVIAAIVCLAAVPAAAAADTITIAWDPSPDSRVAGYVAYVQYPSGDSRMFDAGMNVVFAFNEAVAGQSYCFAVAAYTGSFVIGDRSAQVCGYSSSAPTLTSPGDQQSVIGQPVGLQLDGRDPDGQPLTYSAAGLPPGLTLQSSTGFISGIPTMTGSSPVTITVSDSALSTRRTFTWTIVASGAPPPSAGPLALTNLTANRSAPQPVGTAITFTATVTGGIGPQFKWWVSNGSNWFVTRDWTTSNTWTWTPTVANSAYQVAVWVRNVTTTADTFENSQSVASIPFPITGSGSSTPSAPTGGVLTLTSLSADRPAPQPAGTVVTFTATAIGGTSPYQYKWLIYDGGGWYVGQQWTSSNRWTWTLPSPAAGAQVAVWVRNANSTADAYDNPNSSGSIAYPITAGSGSSSPPPTAPSVGPLTLTGLSADRPAPQPAGSSITFTASATGGIGPYQYKWWIYDGGGWYVGQQWTSSNRWTWTPPGPSSEARVGVWVRNAGSTADAYDNEGANGSIPYPISSGSSSTSPPPSTSEPLTLTGIYPSRPAPSPVGFAVQFSATTSGGRAPHQFKWWIFDGSTWHAMTGWSTNNTWTWTPPYANPWFRVAVWVRNSDSTQDSYDNPSSNGSIAFAVY